MSRIAGRIARVEPRRRVRRLVSGLMSDLPRKNCWTLAEHVGDATPDGTQHLLHLAKWDADAIRDDSCLGEQAMTTLKGWRLLRKLRCSTNRITDVVKAVLALHHHASA